MHLEWKSLRLGPLLLISTIFIISIITSQLIAGFSYKIVIALIIFSIILFITLVNTDFALAILIFSMLFSPEIILGQIPGRDIIVRLDDILLALITFTWLAKTAVNKGLALFIKTPLNKAITAYLLICVVATLKGSLLGYVTPLKGTFYLLRYFEYFLLYLLVANHIHTRKQVKFFVHIFFLTCALVCSYGILQIPSGRRVSAPFEGEIGEPNTFGGYLLLLFCLAAGLLLQNIPRRTKLALGGMAVLSLIPFFFTLSRASYLAIIFSYLALIILSKRKLALVAVMSVIMVSVLILRPEAVFSRIKYTFQMRQTHLVKIGDMYLDPSSSARILSWKESFQDWKKNPLLGRGVGGYGFIDGQYIVTMVETGLIGLLAFLWLLWTIFKNTLYIHKQTEDRLYKGLSLGLLAGFIGLIIHALTANTFIIIRIMESFWFLTAIVMRSPELEEEEKVENSI